MKLDNTKNTKRNVLFGLINKIVTLLLPFFIRTIIIRTIGSEYLGLNSLFSSILQVLNLSELGFGSAVVFSMYRPIAEDDFDGICALLAFYKKVYRIIGAGVAVLGIILIPFLKYMISGEVPQGINIYILYGFYLINTVLSYWVFAYKTSLLNAHQRRDVVSLSLTISQGGMYVLQIGMLLITKNYYAYLVLLPIFTLVNNFLNAYKVKKLYPQYVCQGKIHEREKNIIRKQVPGLMIHRLCQVSRNSFDSIFISAFLGLRISSMYGNYYYIMNAVIAMLQVFSNAMVAGVGNSQVLESREKNYNTMNRVNFAYMWMSGWCSICLLCLYQPFMYLWVGRSYAFDMWVVLLFCIYFYVLQMGVIRGVYSDAAGLWWQNRYRAIMESICNLLLNFFLGKYFGIQGIIMATLISLFCINFCWGSNIVFQYYFKNHGQKYYYLYHLKYFLVTAVAGGVTYLICTQISMGKLGTLMVRGILCVIVPNVVYFLCYYFTKEYRDAMPWALKKMKLDKRLGFLIPARKEEA